MTMETVNNTQEKKNGELMVDKGTSLNTNQAESKSDQEGNTCKLIINWVIQVSLWVALIDIFYTFSHNIFSLTLIIVTSLIYIVYLINNLLFSSTHSYLDHLVKLNNLDVFMNRLFRTQITKTFKVENYHYENQNTVEWLLSKKNKKNKIVTSKDEQQFQFTSWRDISGPLLINKDTTMDYLRLKLDKELIFENEETKCEYERQKQGIKERNTGKDECLQFSEETHFDNFSEYILIKLHEKENPFLNSTIFFIFTVVIPVIEIYKLFFSSQTAFQRYVIKKTVSTTSNLNENIFAEKYKASNPQVIIYTSEIENPLPNLQDLLL